MITLSNKNRWDRLAHELEEQDLDVTVDAFSDTLMGLSFAVRKIVHRLSSGRLLFIEDDYVVDIFNEVQQQRTWQGWRVYVEDAGTTIKSYPLTKSRGQVVTSVLEAEQKF